MFAITRHDAQANSDAMSSTIQIHTLFARMLIDSSLMYSFVWVSFAILLSMFVATPMGAYVMVNGILGGYLVMIIYKEILVNLVFLNL